MCHVRMYGKDCYRNGCGREVPMSEYAVMLGEDKELHSYHESCCAAEQRERAVKQSLSEHNKHP